VSLKAKEVYRFRTNKNWKFDNPLTRKSWTTKPKKIKKIIDKLNPFDRMR
jgi:hypothetical protein